MAASYINGQSDGRQWTASPRPKGRENAKNTLCRNVTIYGYCRHEKDGCLYNHDASKPSASTSQSDSMKKRLNVDSPSFTPILLDGNASTFGSKALGLSPKAAVAAPFTPKSSKAGSATPPIVTRHHSSEWSNHDIPEFIPQGFNLQSMGEVDPFNTFNDSSSYNNLEATPPHIQTNPYRDEAPQGGQPFYQNMSGMSQPLLYHLYAPSGPNRENLLAYQRSAHDFFIPENLRQDLQRKSEATLQILPSQSLKINVQIDALLTCYEDSNLPPNIEHFHSLVPLDTNNQKSSSAFGYNSWVYKAVSSKDGYTYVLRRLEGFRLTNDKAIRSVQAWKRINNSSIVTYHDCFTTRAFGDSSLVFVSDYHPVSKTLAEQYLSTTSTFSRVRQAAGAVAESVLWALIVQLASAVKGIHMNGLAARVITTSKVILTSKNRIRLNACGILDVVQPNESSTLASLQEDDLRQIGRLILVLATSNPAVASNPKSLDLMSRSYSERFRNCVGSLVNPQQTLSTPPITDIDTLLTSIADHAFSSFDNALHLEDTLCSDLYRELENSRIVRLLAKLGFVNERPEVHEHPLGNSHSTGQWSETGERYYLKLFRDYVFHQVNADGRPVVDLGHVLGCLNKLDAGSEEKIALISRDEQNVFVVSYKEIKRALEAAFQELTKAGRR